MSSRTPSKIDTRAIGLDVGLAFIRWLTGAENLHYGLWTGLDPDARNLRAAQEAYTDRLFRMIPQGRSLNILDIGGGAGETARKLLARGHKVEIVVPSPFLAGRCRANAPEARVHECTFEAFAASGRFDLCLFSESFQYIPAAVALAKACDLLAPGGEIVIGDCFRTDAYRGRAVHGPKPGGGHKLSDVRREIAAAGLSIAEEEDVTEAAAPSIDVEQGLIDVFGLAARRIDAEMVAKKPGARWLLHRVLRLVLSERRRRNLSARLAGEGRTSAEFKVYNRYVLMRLALKA